MLRKGCVSAPDDHHAAGACSPRPRLARGSHEGGIGLRPGLSSAGKPARGGRTAPNSHNGQGMPILYTMSAIDARLRELRTRLRQEREAR